jgi:hypothetical protein
MKNLLLVTALSLITVTGALAKDKKFNRTGSVILDNFDQRDAYYDRYISNRQQQKIRIHLGEHYRGFNVLKLKQLAKQQHPSLNLQQMKLSSVKLVAKSKRGMGQATLLVGQNFGLSETIGGNRQEFHVEAPYTYDRVRLSSNGMNSQGKWQIELQGNIKVKKVVLIVEQKRTHSRIQTLRIPMYGQQYRGFNVLKIKQLIKQQNPRMNLQQMKIQSITLMAKSKQGRGEATMIIGQSAGYPEVVGGQPRAFNSQAPRSYKSVLLQNPSYSSQGKWQVELQGNIKVKTIIVHLKKKGSGPVMRTPTNPRNPRRGTRRGRSVTRRVVRVLDA